MIRCHYCHDSNSYFQGLTKKNALWINKKLNADSIN